MLLAEAVRLPDAPTRGPSSPASPLQPGIENPDDATPSLLQSRPTYSRRRRRRRSTGCEPGSRRLLQSGSRRRSGPDPRRRLPRRGRLQLLAFNPSPPQGHLRGGQRRAQNRPAARSASTADCGTGPAAASTSEQFYNPGRSVADNQPTGAIGGHGTARPLREREPARRSHGREDRGAPRARHSGEPGI